MAASSDVGKEISDEIRTRFNTSISVSCSSDIIFIM